MDVLGPHASDPRGRRVLAVVFALFGGTGAWAIRFALAYLFVPTACQVGDWVLHLVGLVGLLGALGAILAAWRLLARAHDRTTRFVLLAGQVLNVFFLGAILLESIAVFFIDACAKGAIP